MSEAEIREMAGVVGCNSGYPDKPSEVVIIEDDHKVRLVKPQGGYDALFSPAQAHRLARQLHRLATRIERRSEQQ